MRFDCGETFSEKRKRLSLWHKWFAWYPVSLDIHDCRWLEFVERRLEYEEGWHDSWWSVEYREILK